MRVPRLLCLVLLSYLALDVASPVIPGVFQLVDGTIKIVHADRARPEADTPILSVVLPAWLAIVAHRSLKLMQQPRPRCLTPRRRSRPRRRPLSTGRDLDRSEDH